MLDDGRPDGGLVLAETAREYEAVEAAKRRRDRRDLPGGPEREQGEGLPRDGILALQQISRVGA